jgi:hypothetical protein
MGIMGDGAMGDGDWRSDVADVRCEMRAREMGYCTSTLRWFGAQHSIQIQQRSSILTLC